MRIIGITGTIGAGKGEVVEYLKKKGFTHFSAREFILNEVRKRGLEANRDNTTSVANDLRKAGGPGYIIESLYKMAEATEKDSVIESVRAIGEVNFLRAQENFTLLAVDADPKIRYERVIERKSALDHVTFEKFLSDEQREMLSSDPTKGSISDCIKLADFKLMNDGTREELYAKVEEILEKLPK